MVATRSHREFYGWIFRLQLLVVSVFCCCCTRTAFFWPVFAAFADGKPARGVTVNTNTNTNTNTSDLRGLLADADADADAISEPSPRIVNGVEVTTMRYPYVAILNQGHVLKCGGVLIAPDIILTAAHCSESVNEVQLGRHNRSDTTEEYESLIVESLVTHPRYYRNRFLDTDPHDFAVAKIFGRSRTAMPIAINSDPNTPVPDQELHVFGWGSVDPNDLTAQSDVLLGASAYYLPNEECKTFVGNFGAHKVDYRRYVIDVSLCARNFEEGSDSCRGDSGSGLVREGRDASEDLLVGIVSAGFGCANPTLPALYARVSEVHEWIRDQVCEMSEDPPASFGCADPASSSSSSSSPELDGAALSAASCDDNSASVESGDEPWCTALTVSLRLDSRPEEQGWLLRTPNERGVWTTEAERPIFSYNHTQSQSVVTETMTVRNNREYEFVLIDSYGDIVDVGVTIVDESGNELLSHDESITTLGKRYNVSYAFAVGELPTSAPTSWNSASSTIRTTPTFGTSPTMKTFLSIVIRFGPYPENIGYLLHKWNNETTTPVTDIKDSGNNSDANTNTNTNNDDAFELELVNAVYPGTFSSDLADGTIALTIPLRLPAFGTETYRFTMTSNEGRGFESESGGYEVWLGYPLSSSSSSSYNNNNNNKSEFLFDGSNFFYLEDTHVFSLEPDSIEPSVVSPATPVEYDGDVGGNVDAGGDGHVEIDGGGHGDGDGDVEIDAETFVVTVTDANWNQTDGSSSSTMASATLSMLVSVLIGSGVFCVLRVF